MSDSHVLGIGEKELWIPVKCDRCKKNETMKQVAGVRFAWNENSPSVCGPCQYDEDVKSGMHYYGGQCWCGKHGGED